MTTEIPIWVSGKLLWVTGVDKKTTVNDVVETLLGQPDKDYSIAEKWRGVERPLNGDTRILKLWKTWGDARSEVKLSLKKIITENDSGRSSPSSYASRKRRKHKSTCKYGQTIHPKRLSQLSKTQNIEKLLKLILLQGETIQSQISKLKDKDNQIEYLESEQHHSRIKALGTNYVLETYLGTECDEVEDSGVVTECTRSSENNSTPTGEDSKDEEITIDEDVETEITELQNKIHLLEKVVKINKKLEKEEENLVRLYINIERCKKNDQLINDLTVSLEQLTHQCTQSENELQKNSLLLTDVESVLSSRKCYLNKLLHEMSNPNDKLKPEILNYNESNIRSVRFFQPTICSMSDQNVPNKPPVLDTLV